MTLHGMRNYLRWASTLALILLLTTACSAEPRGTSATGAGGTGAGTDIGSIGGSSNAGGAAAGGMGTGGEGGGSSLGPWCSGWARTAGGSGEEYVAAVTSGADGSTYVAGWTYLSDPIFGIGTPLETTLSTNATMATFVAKYEIDGTLGWATLIDSTDSNGTILPFDMAVAPNGSLIVIGRYWPDALLGAGEVNETLLATPPSPNTITGLFVASYNANGAIEWVKTAVPPDGSTAAIIEPNGASLGISPNGDIWVAGRYAGTYTFGVGEPGATTITTPPGTWQNDAPIFLAKFSADGTFNLVRRIVSDGQTAPPVIAANSSGGVVMRIHVVDALTFDPSGPNETTVPAIVGYQSTYLADYASNGGFLGLMRVSGGPTNYHVNDIDLGSDGSLLLTGFVKTQVTLAEGTPEETTIVGTGGGGDILLAKYDPSRTLQWVATAGGDPLAGNDDQEGVGGIAATADGGAVVTGLYTGALTFAAGTPDETNLPSAIGKDFFVARFGASGELLHTAHGGGPQDDDGVAIAVAADGGAVIAGIHDGPMTVSWCGGPPETLTWSGAHDLFLAKYAPGGP